MCIRDRFMGIPAISYAPYAILCWVNPFVSAFYAITGISVHKLSDEEYERILANREKTRQEALEALKA